MRVVLSWSSGKDAAWALHVLRQRGVEVAALLTTIDEATQRVGMHGVAREVVQAQADAAGLPLRLLPLPWPASNAVYEAAVRGALAAERAGGATHVAFGDLFLDDVRRYREQLLQGTGLQPLFPLWHPEGGTAALARAMLAGGLGATVCCVDGARLAPAFVGRRYDASFLADLPPGVDPCGERGAFHTVCTAGPAFEAGVEITLGPPATRAGFVYADVSLRKRPS